MTRIKDYEIDDGSFVVFGVVEALLAEYEWTLSSKVKTLMTKLKEQLLEEIEPQEYGGIDLEELKLIRRAVFIKDIDDCDK